VLVVALSSCNLRLHFSELSLEVQGGHDYFRFVEGTCITALCLSSFSLSLFYPLQLVLNITSEVELYLLLISVFSLGENEEKENTIQPPLCFSHLHIEDREVKQLREKVIVLVKVIWIEPTGEIITWESDSRMKESYSQLFPSGNFQGQKFFKGGEL